MEVSEHKMLQNVFHLDDRPVTSLIVSRADVHSLDGEMTIVQAFRLCAEGCEMGRYSWYPACYELRRGASRFHQCFSEILGTDSDTQEFF